jgi:hypothetical protein
MSVSTTASEFEMLIKKHYKFLIDDFGFTLNKLGDWSFSLETKNAMVSFLVEHASLLSVALVPIGEEAARLLRQNILPNGISVIVISMCLDPTLQYKIQRLNNKNIDNNIPIEMERRAELLKKYCNKMLNGDFSDWGAIENCMSSRAYEFLHI